jgi:hypothetical protein
LCTYIRDYFGIVYISKNEELDTDSWKEDTGSYLEPVFGDQNVKTYSRQNFLPSKMLPLISSFVTNLQFFREHPALSK